jgi:hypothetical protein
MVHGQEVAMRPIRLDTLSAEQLRELDELYHLTHEVRVRTRAHGSARGRARLHAARMSNLAISEPH